MKSENGYIFGGYSKIGFIINKNREYLIDNYSFLFSKNLNKIYPVIKDKTVICHIKEIHGLCFYHSLCFRDNFMNKSENKNFSDVTNYFNGFENKYEMNGGQNVFKFNDIEVFQLL